METCNQFTRNLRNVRLVAHFKFKDFKPKAFSRDEILTHCTSDSLWIIIDNLVYDFTKFRTQHPGGASILEQFGGNDGTEAFVRYGHSRLAKNIMKKYLIGKVEQSNLMESLSRSHNQFQIGGGFGKSS
ncbi:cytochrome b5-like [Convolutriloba macropyga]|uniref:cytochrome b5-like n=1 Tax=Convolutriloba macropyga TaxID=536237 RepID=UPI003F520518